ncbi:peptide deformylase [Lacihabitans sp. LS3-19]|uniref:peptide deformylase n=1 Tax=Lacihabitans sp. LS3-19 TaxID=2487335 RepID=UPI0020CD9663|nr:peptide deformylase [Lacihabitans sp. LS3-19]MCP9767297.1 peptide deformylase [Lacihabitans sp. LS3-19]
MKTVNDLLVLGNPILYEKSTEILKEELPLVKSWVQDLHEVMEDIRAKYNFGRAIAAPQLGNMKRLIYMNIEKPKVFINPKILNKSEEMFEVWDDCMCFPNLFVKVMRHKFINVEYFDENWEKQTEVFENDLSELFQHEFDHLEGILCTMRAIDNKSFRWRAMN